jgi:DNA polymerase-3 subunit beta
MKCVISREALLSGLQIVQNVVSTRTTLPILGNALVQAADGKLIISTTDLDTGIRASVEAEVIKGGATTLPARRLFSIIRELPAAELTLEVDSKQVATITSGTSFFRIMGLPEEDFPPFPKGDGAKTFKLTQGVFRDMLKRTAYAISTDESRYVLNGVLLSFKENKLSLVATDGRRLALVEQDIEFPKGSEVEAILPTKAVQELQRILRDEEPLTISFAENQVSFDLGNTFLYSKLIEGNYPNYKQVVPAEAKERIILERELFLNAVRRVALLSSEKSNSVKLIFSRNNLDITANTPEVGEAKESIAIVYKGNRLQSRVPDGSAQEHRVGRNLLRLHRRAEPRRHQIQAPVPLRHHAHAHRVGGASFQAGNKPAWHALGERFSPMLFLCTKS